MKIYLLALFTFFYLCGSAQSWQLSGVATSTSQAERQSAKQIYLTIADNNGVAVTGLKASNFTAWGENCNALGRACTFAPLEIVKQVAGITSFDENIPGLYIITFQIKADPGISISHIFIKVSTWRLGASGPNERKVVTTQHAQILL